MRSTLSLLTLFACLLGAAAVCAGEAETLLKVIQSNNASDVDRANAFEKIGDIAGEDAVESLTVFLSDERWSHYARFAFQKMEGDNVTKALLGSLDTLQGELQIGVIDTLGRRRDSVAVAPLAELLTSSDEKLAAAAAASLGMIGTKDTAMALSGALSGEQDQNRRESLAAALLIVGQRLADSGTTESAIRLFDRLSKAELPKPYRIGATQNAILARGANGVDLMVEQLKSSDHDYFQVGLAVARVLPGGRATEAVTKLLETTPQLDRQVLLILALRDRGDNQALSAVLEKLTSDSTEVQLAAIDATGTLGDDASVSSLLAVTNATNFDAVLAALIDLKGDGVNEALRQAAEAPKTSTLAIKALGQRRAKEAVPLLFTLSTADSAAIRQEAIVALGRVVTQERFLDLFALLKSANSGDRKAAIQEAIHAAVYRSTEPDACAEALGTMIPGSSGADREFLFEQVRTAGGARAVELMGEFATGSDEALQDAATKTLGRWLSADAAPILMQVAQSGGRFANRALGGYIRIFRQFELPESERVALAAQALKVAGRSNERNAAIEGMTRFPCVGTFELALDQLDVPGSEATAAQAVLTIGRTVLDLDPEMAKAGLQRLIDANVSREMTESAKALQP